MRIKRPAELCQSAKPKLPAMLVKATLGRDLAFHAAVLLGPLQHLRSFLASSGRAVGQDGLDFWQVSGQLGALGAEGCKKLLGDVGQSRLHLAVAKVAAAIEIGPLGF